MGTKSRVLVGAISITIVVVATACSDGTTAPAPEAYVTTGVARVMNPASGQLEVVNPPLSEGVNADVVVGSSAQSALLVADNAPGVAPTASHADYSYVDSQGRANKVVFLWHTSGPVTAAYHFVNGTLVAYTAFNWTKIQGGYYNSMQTLHVVTSSGAANGSYALAGTYTQTTQPCKSGTSTNCGPGQMVERVGPVRKAFVMAALALAYSCAPSDALAQGDACVAEWLTYIGSMALVISEASVPVIGWAAAAGTMLLATVALKQLVDCRNRSSHPVAANGSGGAGGGGGAESGGCGGGIVTQACVQLTYTE